MDATARTERRDYWAAMVDDWRESGQSMAAYCRAHELAYWQFLYWRGKLADETAPAGFVALEGDEDCGIRVRLVGGRVELVLARGFDVGELSRAMAALGSDRC